MKMENDVLCVEIAELGAEITRIYDKENDTEVLWNGDARFWKRHSPILFPNVGKTWKNTLCIDLSLIHICLWMRLWHVWRIQMRR